MGARSRAGVCVHHVCTTLVCVVCVCVCTCDVPCTMIPSYMYVYASSQVELGRAWVGCVETMDDFG